MKYLIIFIMSICLMSVAGAADKVYKRGQDQVGTVTCTNPTTRTDGTALDVTEIAKVELYIDEVEGNVDTPNDTFVMMGGCQTMQFPLQNYPSGTVFYVYGRTFDTSDPELVSVVSPEVSNTSFVIQNANPNAPGQWKLSQVIQLLLLNETL